MNKILSSATKITLLLMVLWLLAFVAIGRVDSETFKVALLMVLSFYFGKVTSDSNTPTV